MHRGLRRLITRRHKVVISPHTGACFEIRATTPRGTELRLGDGGFTPWTADLLSNAKERLLISGLGLELLWGQFRATAG